MLTQGYGASLTKLFIENNIVNKKSINSEGNKRINNEINFYKYIRDKKFYIYTPKILSSTDYDFKMEYLKNYITIEKYFRINSDEINSTVKKIFDIIDLNLHNESKKIDIKEYKSNLFLETIEKAKSRTKIINNIILNYEFIKKVNNVKILDINIILYKLNKIIENYINCNELLYFPIHGDLQLNNILIDVETKEIKFIDPRGYFGNSKIYGMKEYDYAKIFFGLGGYSYFDLKVVTDLTIKNNDNIIIDMKEMINIFELPNIIQVFIIFIWLGNAHCFLNNELKVVESYFYALYISTLYLEKNNIINN